MTRITNLNDSPEQRTAKRFAALEAQAPVGSTSITKPDGRLRVASLNGILAQSIPGGGAAITVDGRQTVTGTLDGTGTFTWTGPVNIGGTCTISGPLNVTGNVTTSGSFTNSGTFTNNGATNLNGATTVKGDLNVTTPGKIKVGSSMTLDPSVSSGAVVFSNGAQVFTDATTIQVYKGNGVVQISNTEAKLQLGGMSVSLTPSGLRLGGVPKATKAGIPAGCYYKGTDGLVYEA